MPYVEETLPPLGRKHRVGSMKGGHPRAGGSVAGDTRHDRLNFGLTITSSGGSPRKSGISLAEIPIRDMHSDYEIMYAVNNLPVEL